MGDETDQDRYDQIKAYWRRAKIRNEEGKYAALPDDVVDDPLWLVAESAGSGNCVLDLIAELRAAR